MKTYNDSRNKTFFVCYAVFAVTVSVLLFQGCAQTSQESPSASCQVSAADQIFTDASTSVVNEANDRDLGSRTLRRRLVNIDAGKLKELLNRGSGRMSRLELFPDRSLDLLIEQVDHISDNNIVVTGKLAGDPLSSVTLVYKDDVLVANFNSYATNEKFEVRPIGKGVHAVRAAGEDLYNDCQSVPAPAATAEEQALSESTEAGPLSDNVIDMLVVYTPAARDHQGGKSAIEALIQMGIADTNRAFADSGVALRARLVGTMELSQNESSDLNSDLSSLRGTTDGKWDEVHAERKRLGADQVTLVAAYLSNSSAAGIGYLNASASSAFTIMRDSYFGQYTMAHELGHNLGLNHSDGLESSAGKFRTIIAYGSYPRIRRYSNPSLPYNGYATGDSSHDEAKILNTNATRGANLVATVLPIDPNAPIDSSKPGSPATSGNCY